jgi:hypothetical protein
VHDTEYQELRRRHAPTSAQSARTRSALLTSSIASAASASAARARFTHLQALAYEHPGTDRGEHAEPDAGCTPNPMRADRAGGGDIARSGVRRCGAAQRRRAGRHRGGGRYRAARCTAFPQPCGIRRHRTPGRRIPCRRAPFHLAPGHRTPNSRIPPSAQEVVGGERQSADPGHRWRSYAGRQFSLRGLAELIAETTTDIGMGCRTTSE